MAREALMPSREAFARRDVVLNGAGGASRCSLRVIRSTVAVSPPRLERAMTAWAAPESPNGPPTDVASNGGVTPTQGPCPPSRKVRPSTPERLEGLDSDQFPLPVVIGR